MPHLILILLVSLTLIIAVIAVQLIFKNQTKKTTNLNGDKNIDFEGAPRFIFSALYLCFFWSLFVFWLPMLISYKEKILSTPDLVERIELAAKLSIFPGIFLLLIFLGRRNGYVQWIKQLHWPSDDY